MELKKEIGPKHENGTRITDLVQQYGVAKYSISGIVKNGEAIKTADLVKEETSTKTKVQNDRDGRKIVVILD